MRRIVAGLLVVLVGLGVLVWAITFHPDDVQAEEVTCPTGTPELEAGQPVTVMSWNVQYMAGKDYVFFYDLLDGSGPDERPSAEAITVTLEEVARVIEDESPDVILLQELDDGAARTDGEDQLTRLLQLLPDDYTCHASAFYWKARFVPHPRILGSVGMKLSTVSRYRIDEATRYALPIIPADPLTEQFGLKRAILEVRMPVAGGEALMAYNTHFDAFAQGSDTMQQQVAQASELLEEVTDAGTPWVFGGDLNLLPPGPQYDALGPAQQAYYLPDSELAVLTDVYPVVPSLEDAGGPDAPEWYTHFPNDPAVSAPDRTIDFIFLSPLLELGDQRVRQEDTWDISDHLPVLLEATLP